MIKCGDYLSANRNFSNLLFLKTKDLIRPNVKRIECYPWTYLGPRSGVLSTYHRVMSLEND